MNTEIKIEVVNIDNLTNYNNRVRVEIYKAIQKLTLELTNSIKNDKLTGQVLKVQTGRLRNSIKNEITQSDNEISGSVKTNVKYAKAHEYGFNGNVTVKEHLRTIKQAFGKSIEPKTINVKSFSRNMKLPERSFMRSALKDINSKVKQEIQAALNRAKQ